jgi:hypothetical protein
MDHYSAASDEDSSPEYIQAIENWHYWNGDLDNAIISEDDMEADNESDMEMDNGSVNPATPEQRNETAASNVPGLIRPIQ